MNAPAKLPAGPLVPLDWDEVHAQAQVIFEKLVTRVRSRCPSVRVVSGKTMARALSLYTYRAFNVNPDDSETENIGVGITFSPASGGVRIAADIGGEETGCIDYEIPARVVPADLAAVLAATRELAEELGQQDEVVENALAERRPPPNYRKEAHCHEH